MARSVALIALVAVGYSVALPAMPLETADADASEVVELASALWAATAVSPSAFGRELQETPAAAPKTAYSIWSTAKHFFIGREKAYAKAHPGSQPAAEMPKEFGLGYKQMVDWYCKSADNAAKTLCKRTGATGTAKPSSFATKPEVVDSINAAKAYCAVAANKAKPLCTMAHIPQPKAAATGTSAPAAASASASAPGAPAAAAKKAGGKGGGAKRAAKKAAAAAGATKLI